MSDQPVREKTAAEVFAELCALPERISWKVERERREAPDPEVAAQLSTPWALMDGVETKAEAIARKKAEEERYMASVRPRTHWSLSLTLDGERGGPSLYGHGQTLAQAWAMVRVQIAAFAEVL